MVKTWSADNPKAVLMPRKRAAIVNAAPSLFPTIAAAPANRIIAQPRSTRTALKPH
ncbi:hypothetical protein MSAS_17050 [Mycobacterium saskatchewanense]|nr:hypothetical protein MSAS_17050 [Mycobacterium saskatchewanense]